jgi:phospholipase C
MALNNIEHLVVVMMENRSFDNLLGWLYDDLSNPPSFNLPTQPSPTFEGLRPNTFSNVLNGNRVYATHPPTAWPPANNPNAVPTPDPHEEFPFVNLQLFGTASPAAGVVADMSGFLLDYSAPDAGGASAAQIMQTFGPADANVLNDLARNFAVWTTGSHPCPRRPGRTAPLSTRVHPTAISATTIMRFMTFPPSSMSWRVRAGRGEFFMIPP